MFLAVQHCNLHWNILGYGSGCKVVSFQSKCCILAPVGMVNIFPAHTRFLSFPLFPRSVSLTCLCFSDEDFYCSAFESSRGCIGRSELMYGLFLVRVKKGKKTEVLNQKFPFGIFRQQTSLWCQSLALMISILMTSRSMWMP